MHLARIATVTGTPLGKYRDTQPTSQFVAKVFVDILYFVS